MINMNNITQVDEEMVLNSQSAPDDDWWVTRLNDSHIGKFYAWDETGGSITKYPVDTLEQANAILKAYCFTTLGGRESGEPLYLDYYSQYQFVIKYLDTDDVVVVQDRLYVVGRDY